ncbi:MAG: ABC transporter permease subunit [Candidatus Dormibacteria bacterium]
MGLILQAVVAGLAAGAVYGLIGIGYGLIYRMSGVFNFAHGDLVTAGIFAFLLVLGGGAAVAAGALSPAATVAAIAIAVAVTTAAAVLIQRVAVAPFIAVTEGARTGVRGVGWIAATVAAGLLLRSLVGIRFQAESYTVPEILPVGGIGNDGLVGLPGGGVLQVRSVVVLAIALVLALFFDRWLAASRTGRAMQAAAQDADAARLLGISPERLRLVAWAIAGVLAAIAGLLLAPARPITLDLGVVLGLKGTAAAVLGRLGDARRIIVAGLLIGVFESVLTTLPLPGVGPLPGLQDVGALLLLVVALAALPGLLEDSREVVD